VGFTKSYLPGIVGSTISKRLASFFPIIPSRYLETYLPDIKGNCFLKSQVKALLEEGRGTLGFMGIEPTLISGLWGPYSHKALFQNP
jgi:hypothetical protein